MSSKATPSKANSSKANSSKASKAPKAPSKVSKKTPAKEVAESTPDEPAVPEQKITLENSRPFDLNGYELRAKVLAIPADCNTVVLGIFLFRTRWQIRCRHASFTADGPQARQYLTSLLVDTVVTARFGPNDKFGRALVDIWLRDGRALARSIIAEGRGASFQP
jgi:hypothetical protein